MKKLNSILDGGGPREKRPSFINAHWGSVVENNHFVPRRDAKLLPRELNRQDYTFGGEKIPGLSASSSIDSMGAVHMTLCNLDPQRPAAAGISGRP